MSWKTSYFFIYKELESLVKDSWKMTSLRGTRKRQMKKAEKEQNTTKKLVLRIFFLLVVNILERINKITGVYNQKSGNTNHQNGTNMNFFTSFKIIYRSNGNGS